MENINVEETQPKNSKDVDLDTDGIKEQDVQVKEQEKKEEAPNLNVGEVDLGYTDHSKDKLKAEVKVEEDKEEVKVEEKPEPKQAEPEKKAEQKPANLKKKKDDYQSRIDKLTFKVRESQRREKAAVDYAKGLQKKYDVSQKKINQTDEQYLKEFDARVDAQREQVKSVLKQAIEAQDSEKIMEANDKLTQLAVQKEKARLEIQHRADVKKQEEEENKAQSNNNNQQNVEAQTSSVSDNTNKISAKAKKWAEENSWYGNDEVMTNAAQTIHANVVTEGIEVDSDEYYNEINSRLRKYFPASFADEVEQQPKQEQRKPVQTVASAGRKQEGRRTVRLTASQVAIAKKLNVPLEEYAKYVKEDK